MPLNHYITLGRSGLRVSPLCLGTMTFGEEWGWGSNPQDSAAILHRYLEDGGNFLDTANVYTKGHSEKIIGDHLGRDRGRRQRVVIATKFFGNMFLGDPNAGGGNRKAIVASCEDSLRRLQTDYIDLYWMHCWDKTTPIDETMRALDDLVRTGKVRYLGFSDTPAWKVAQAQVLAAWRDWSPLVGMQIEYSLLERTVEGDLIPAALELGLGVTPWSPLKGGLLTGKYTRDNAATAQPGRGQRITQAFSEPTFQVIDALLKMANEAGTTPSRVALAWLQSQPGVASIIIGARTMGQLEDNLGSLDVKLSADQLQALSDASKPSLNFPADFLTFVPTFAYGGTTINGVPSESWPMMPQRDEERY